jgi:hypothetical protein
MPTDYLERPAHSQYDADILTESESPVLLSHYTAALGRYKSVILLALAGVTLAYLIIAIAIYLFAPAEQITSQPFRLGFEGAGQGEYPNKTKFNIAEIINGPILTRVWQSNRLGDYIPFGDFSRSIFILESNREYERLAAEYQAKLSDPKNSPVDRERLQKEFELKAQSITKNEYSINLARRAGSRSIPEPLARKILLDFLNDWADFAINQQHVIEYQVSVLSPNVLTPSAIEENDLVAAIEVLRSKANRVITNVEKIEKLPGATLARTPGDHLSFEEVRIRLDEIMRFRLEPLLAATLHSPSFITDRAATIRFLQSQLAYDQRQLESSQRLAESIRESIAVYEAPTATPAQTLAGAAQTAEQPKGSEAVMPQLSDSFLDRLVTMTGRSADALYRQGVIDDYRKAVADTLPHKQAVAFDTQVMMDLQKPSGGPSTLTAAAVRAQIEQTREEVAQLINKTNELFQIVSRNMTPSTQLFSVTSPPTTRIVRAFSAQWLVLCGVLVLLVALPAIILSCLLHNRVREEETMEEFMRAEHLPAP